ncbi:methylenetetrahydrofolate reductase [NAD(P)H] [Luteolibacter pohnpeiensis]|uniref:Methylenetetrahydrofolate reductase n=1 Tax=Luteolibacter pohnpeiensis TaxID=454153 RepID=A0A934VUN9_9BACT|nr:methylenetetrahydrofolate reductase [NAD(P)H] [Luteolibacter pohnpeiensis]MBK1880958.1 methylenetetrahydrofolate reductase [NAD(P)H] [Luteolibacter pohnpeiensis]
MHIRDILAGPDTKFSFEFFPPRTKAVEKSLLQSISELENYSPSFISVTYGAGGSTRDATHELVLKLKQQKPFPTIPHLTGIGHTKDEVTRILEQYVKAGIRNLLVLRGDSPRMNCIKDGDFRYASDLVNFIQKFSEKHRCDLGIGVAAYPEGHPDARNRMVELDHLKAKAEAGADFICTQLFFDNRDFLDFRERCEIASIRIPILAGIMPITRNSALARISEFAARSRIPAKLMKAMQRSNGNDAVAMNIGIHHATQQCADLLDHQVAGIHFYTLNQSTAVQRILSNLGMATCSR